MEPEMTIEELKVLMASNQPVTLLDVRKKQDRSALPLQIPEASWKDPQAVSDWASELPGHTPVVAYCKRGGPVSRSVVNALAREGLQAVVLTGGIQAWQDAALPLENIKGEL